MEVPGPPAEVWEAIATGPGISAWFVPTEIETGAGGKPVRVASHFGPGTQEYGAIVRVDEPAAGIRSTFALPMDGKVDLVLNFFHYGKIAASAVEQWEPQWRSWMKERFGKAEV